MNTMLMDLGTVQTNELKNALRMWPQAELVVDVSDPAEFRVAHIPGSINAPLGHLHDHVEAIRAAGRGRQIVLVSRTSRRALMAGRALALCGVSSSVLVGGMEGWIMTGGAVTSRTTMIRRLAAIAGAALAIIALLACA
jgi:rhodanese-related sulfurtransferase